MIVVIINDEPLHQRGNTQLIAAADIVIHNNKVVKNRFGEA